MQRPPKVTAISWLDKVNDKVPELKKVNRDSPEFAKWHRDTRVALENIFADQPERVTDFTRVFFSPFGISTGTPESEFQRAYVSGLEEASAILQSMIEEIQVYWGEDDTPDSLPTRSPEMLPFTNEVFVIHGSDHGTKNTVARFLENLGLEPIILHEQPDEGRTIIEKFEEYAKTSYAIALLTPDDVGGKNENELHSRARQNVILELGYFLGKLGRNRVCALVKGQVEIPSDYSGALYIPFDETDGWKMKLVGELKSSGFEVDANRAFD